MTIDWDWRWRTGRGGPALPPLVLWAVMMPAFMIYNRRKR